MVYCKRFEDGTTCVIHAPANISQAEIDFLLETGRREILKMKKSKKVKTAVFAILGTAAAAVSAIFLVRKYKKV